MMSAGIGRLCGVAGLSWVCGWLLAGLLNGDMAAGVKSEVGMATSPAQIGQT